MFNRALLFAAISACYGCGAESASKPHDDQPADFDAEISLPQATDLNPDPHVVELRLEAKVAQVELVKGLTTEVWTYDGGLPGPTIRANVGDRVIVHFTNSLPEPTTIHWHGVRVPADMDGAPMLHGQEPIAPGGSFDYDFVVPDAGTFWYHPHFDSGPQVSAGLYGAFIVDDPSTKTEVEDALGDELVMILSDIGVDTDTGKLFAADSGGDFGTLFGREGTLMLVNGRVNPTIHARAGARQRWRLINAAIARYYEVSLPGHTLTRIGSDGGLLEHPERLDSLLLTPAQRADVVLEPGSALNQDLSQPLALRWKAYDRGFGTAYNRPDEDVLHIDFDGRARVQAPALPRLERNIAPLELDGATPIDIELTLNPEEDGTLAMGINGVPSWKAGHVPAKVGERQVWTVKNTFDWDHPFHLHGFFFQVLDLNGVAPSLAEWRDTVNIPVDGKLRFIVQYDDRPGMWMFHCHILDHADAGMMGMIRLE